MKPNYEADLTPPEAGLPPGAPGWPRVRFNFNNGWSASVILRCGPKGMDAQLAALACWPTGKVGQGLTELGNQEAFPDEAAAYLSNVASRPRP